MKHAAGFTLLEVLAALVLLALLLLGVYSGIRTATHSAHAGAANIEQLDGIRSAQQFLSRDLAQAFAQTIARDDHGNNIFFSGSAHEMRFVAPLPGYLGRLGPQLQRLELVDDGQGSLRLQASFAVLPPDGSPPQPVGDTQVLLDGIRSGSFSYRGIDPDNHAGDWRGDWKEIQRLPNLVGIDLVLDDGRSWPAMRIPLRVSAAGTQGPGNLLRGLRGPGMVQ